MGEARPDRRRALRTGVVVIGVAGLLLLLLAMVPLGWLRPLVERRLSTALGRPVTVARMVREDWIGFVPTVRLDGVEVAAPAWAGSQPTARIATLRVSAPLLPLLVGHVGIRTLEISGARLRLFRTADGRATWLSGRIKHDSSKADPFADITRLVVRDTSALWSDESRHMRLLVSVAADRSVRLVGHGTQRDARLAFDAWGGPIVGEAASHPYPFRVHLSSRLTSVAMAGRMDRPLSFSRFSARIATRAGSADLLDDVIDTGLPDTQPVVLSAALRHDPGRWRLDDLSGQIGSSPLRGHALIRQAAGRTRIDADLYATRFDFDDLSGDADHAEGRRRRALIGPRLFPESPIHLEHLATLDGRLVFRTPQLVVKGGSMFKRLSGTVTLDRRRLTVNPLRAGLAHGEFTGVATVDGRTDLPVLGLDVRVRDEQISDFFSGQDRLLGALQGRVVATGRGRTIREAVGRLDGRIGIASPHSTIQKRLAVFAGGDVLKSVGQLIGSGGDDRLPVNCMVGELVARGGLLRPRTLVLDTAYSRLDGSGWINLANERIDLVLAGRPKNTAALVVHPPIRLTGTLSDPALVVAGGDTGSPRKDGLLGRIGRILGSVKIVDHPRAAAAPPLNCRGLAARALR